MQLFVMRRIFGISIQSLTHYQVKQLLIILTFVILTNCDNNQNAVALCAESQDLYVSKALEKSKVSKESELVIERILSKNMQNSDFELDTGIAYIKIGKFLKPEKSNALVIRFSIDNMLTIYELRNNNWETVYQQDNIGLSRAYEVRTEIADYNFDGENDLGIQNVVSNGAAIRYFHLWLSEGNSFKYIPEFESVGNPVILTQIKTIHGFTACCVNSEFWLSEYIWNGDTLINTRKLHITDYPTGINSVMKNIRSNSERRATVSKDEISLIDNTYGCNGWTLVANGDLSRYSRWFTK